MTEQQAIEYEPSVASDADRQSPTSEEEPQTPLAWFEIESSTYGEFKQIVRVPFFKGQIITIGRDAKACNLRFQCKAVSAVHCEVYSVLFDTSTNYRPLIYVRDCQSRFGTLVNGELIGKGPFVTPGRMLEQDDTISVGPCSLRLRGYGDYDEQSTLSPLQQKEASHFADQFLIKNTILGSGSFATVHLAVNVETKQQMFCKIHDLTTIEDRFPDTNIIKRVEQEMSIWSQLDHPNIVAFQRAFYTSKTVFTFGGLATGGDLFSLLQREKSISELEIKWIIIQLLRAVEYLHCKGVAHRDIKVENILCSSSLSSEHGIALTDFGCAGVTSRGRMHSYVGTANSRAPYVYTDAWEVQLSGKPHGLAVDIWAVGILAVQLIVGNDPAGIELFEDLSADDIEKSVVLGNAGRAGQDYGPVSQNGVDFTIACLNLRPHKRPTAAEALKHPWFRESEKEIALFKERENKLAWKPRGLIIPAIVELDDVADDTPEAETAAANQQASSPRLGEDEFGGQHLSSFPVPDSVDGSQSSRSIVEQKFEWLQKRSETIVAFERPCSMMNYRSASVA